MTKRDEIIEIARSLEQYLTDPDSRRFVCRESILLFGLYYFDEYITYDLADFHYDMVGDLDDLLKLTFNELCWIIYREGAKTSWAKIIITYLIVYELRHYILWDSVDMENVEAALLDVATTLQSNVRIIEDFGQLYIEPKTKFRDKTQKKVTSFITTTGIKVQGLTVGMSGRGRVYGKYRPDFIVFDDFETEKTVDSVALTSKAKKHMDTLRAGMAADGCALYLCNLISESGIVKNIQDSALENPKIKVRVVNAEENGKPTWKSKYVMTDKELAQRPHDPKAPLISLETKKRTLNASGRKVYEVEMMNSPEAAGDIFFDRKKVDTAIRRIKELDIRPIDEVGDIKYFHKFNPSHRYAIASDSAGGVGRDSCTAVGMDFTQNPNNVFATYRNNEIKPDIFAFELRTIGKKYGECLICPERNNHGHATITRLKDIYPLGSIYIDQKDAKAKDKRSNDLGWDTNSATKPDMLYRFKSAFEDGSMQIDSLELLLEMRAFVKNDLDQISTDDRTTRHFDLLIAAAICYQMGKYAPDPMVKSRAISFKQKPYENPSVAADPVSTPGSDFDSRFAPRSDSAYDSFKQPDYDS